MALALTVPEVGESITEVQIGKWLKQPGDAVREDEPIVEIETDKVTLELPAPAAGKITQADKNQGDEAKVGDVIGYMEEGEVSGSGSGQGRGDAGSQRSDAGSGATEPKEEESPSKAAQPPASSSEAPPPAAGRGEDAAGAEQRRARPVTAGQASSSGAAPAGGGGESGDVKIMPAARRLLEEHQLTADQVQATGPGGRLLKEDVQRHLRGNGQSGEQAPPSAPPPAKAEPRREPSPSHEPEPAAKPAAPVSSPQATRAATAHAPADRAEEVIPMTPMRKRIAQRLVEAQQTGALLTTFNEVNMARIMAMRSQYKQAFQDKHGVKLGFMSFFVKAAVEALKAFPAVNAEVRSTDIAYKNYYDIGIAVGTGKGLVVPVLRSAERQSFAEIEKAIGDFGKRAQDGKLSLDELQGGTFTITNGGVFGSLLSTPIVNPPQSAVLGMHTIQQRAIVDDEGQIVAAPMMYLALTYDHRLVDGREAVTFLRRLKETLEDPARLLMEV